MDTLLKWMKKADAFLMRVVDHLYDIWQGIQAKWNWFFSKERWRLHRTIIRAIRSGLTYFLRILGTAWVLQLAVNWALEHAFMNYSGALAIVFVLEVVYWCRNYLGWPIGKLVGLAVNPNWIPEPPPPPKMEKAYVRPKWRDTLHEQLINAISPADIYYRVTHQGENNALIQVMHCAGSSADQVQRIMAVFQRHTSSVFYSDGVLIQVSIFKPKNNPEIQNFLIGAEKL